MPTVAVDDIEIHYQIDDFTDPWKPAETVLLHHAAIGNTERWRMWIPTLARHYRVVRLDARGHGRSSRPPRDYRWSIERLARDVRDVIDALELGPVHYVGASAGGIIGLQFAFDYPDRIRSLTAIAATPRLAQTKVDFSDWLDRIRRLGVEQFLVTDAMDRFSPDADPAQVRWFAEVGDRTPESVVTTFVPFMATVDLTDKLGAIETPVLLLAADRDRITPMEVQQLMLERLPNARMVVYSTTGHNIADEFPDRCAADTLAFIRQVSAGTVS